MLATYDFGYVYRIYTAFLKVKIIIKYLKLLCTGNRTTYDVVSVHEPAIIRDMMVMKNFTMLKMFLSAVSAGQ